MTRVVFVHGACVRDGAWWWQPTAALLAERGVASTSPVLPSCEGPAGRFAGDVAAVRSALLDGDEPTVVVAHSYGGIVTAEAAAGVPSVVGLLLVSSYLPEVGQSLSSFGGSADFLSVDETTFGVRPERLVETFLHDCSPAVQAEGPSYLARQSLSVLGAPVAAAAWQEVPTTYLVCTGDRGTPVAAQREFARKAGSVVEVDTGHHPFLSRPEVVRDVVFSLWS